MKLRLSLRLHSTAAWGYRAGRFTAGCSAPPVASYEPLPILPAPSQAGAKESGLRRTTQQRQAPSAPERSTECRRTGRTWPGQLGLGGCNRFHLPGVEGLCSGFPASGKAAFLELKHSVGYTGYPRQPLKAAIKGNVNSKEWHESEIGPGWQAFSVNSQAHRRPDDKSARRASRALPGAPLLSG